MLISFNLFCDKVVIRNCCKGRKGNGCSGQGEGMVKLPKINAKIWVKRTG